MPHEPDIAIIGAGAAGIAAARRLDGSGFSVLVIEALPRLGGRAWTQEVRGSALDLGCGWLHSGDRNPWTTIATASGFAVDRSDPAWNTQFRDVGAPAADWQAAGEAFDAWSERLAAHPPATDCAADALEPDGQWNAYIQAISGYVSGDELERISACDYVAYDQASTYANWRLPAGYGTLIASTFPAQTPLQLSTPIERVGLDQTRVTLETPAGTIRCRAAIFTPSTDILAGDTIRWPATLDPWRQAAANLPLGRDEKLFLEIVGNSPFEPETHVLGDLNDPATATYYIRPFGRPFIECFLGGAGARRAEAEGAAAAFARAIDQLAGLFGEAVRSGLRPSVASSWAATPSIGGAYSHALPGHVASRLTLAMPFDGRLFFAGEATHPTDFSTAHGAYHSGRRAAEEAMAVLRIPALSAGTVSR